MAVFQVLSETVGSVELFGLIAFAKFVHVCQMFNPPIPDRLRMIRKFFSTKYVDIISRLV